MKKCGSCGKKNRDTTRFCARCGKDIRRVKSDKQIKAAIPKLNLETVMMKSAAVYSKGFRVFFFLGLYMAIALSGMYFAQIEKGGVLNYVVFAVSLIIGGFISIFLKMGMYFSADTIFKRKKVKASVVWERVKDRFWPYIGMGILYSLVVMAGFFIFFIPGIYFSIIYLFVVLITLVEPSNPHKFSTSAYLVYGNFWKVFFLSLLLGLIEMIPSLPVYIITIPILAGLLQSILSIFIVPFIVVMAYTAYRELAALRKYKGTKADIKKTVGADNSAGCLVATAITGGLVMFLIMAAVMVGVFTAKNKGKECSKTTNTVTETVVVE